MKFFKKKESRDKFVTNSKSILIAIILALIFRTFLFEPYTIPSGSMKPNLLIGDYIFASKYSYGISKHSFPFSPDIFSGKILSYAEPKRGDVVIFKFPDRNNQTYVKRIIGLPGDHIRVNLGVVYVNGLANNLKPIDNFFDFDSRKMVKQYIETNHDGVSYRILDEFEGQGRFDNTIEYVVPQDHYFVMGDNRDNSSDSRDLSRIGFLPVDNIIGRAEVIVFSSEAKWWQFWRWFVTIKSDRFFSEI